jgi:hypothetical protein
MKQKVEAYDTFHINNLPYTSATYFINFVQPTTQFMILLRSLKHHSVFPLVKFCKVQVGKRTALSRTNSASHGFLLTDGSHTAMIKVSNETLLDN